MNKETEGYIVISVIWLVIGLIVSLVINNTVEQRKTFEYAQNGVIGVSSECWLDNDIAKCIVDNKVIRVDNFYLKED